MSRRIAALRSALVAAAVIALEAGCDSGVIPATTLVAPSTMVVALWQLLVSGAIAPDLVATFTSVGIAIVLAAVAGTLAGVIVHAVPRLRAVLTPLLASYYAVPTFIFYPVFIVLLGAGRAPIIAIAFLLAIVAMMTATLAGLDHIPPVWRRTARTLRLGFWRTAVLVVLPGAAPFLFTGLKLVVAYAFIGVIASEFILSGQGLGYAIANAYNDFDNKTMYALMLLVVVVVTAVNLLLHGIDQRLQARRGR